MLVCGLIEFTVAVPGGIEEHGWDCGPFGFFVKVEIGGAPGVVGFSNGMYMGVSVLTIPEERMYTEIPSMCPGAHRDILFVQLRFRFPGIG